MRAPLDVMRVELASMSCNVWLEKKEAFANPIKTF